MPLAQQGNTKYQKGYQDRAQNTETEKYKHKKFRKKRKEHLHENKMKEIPLSSRQQAAF